MGEFDVKSNVPEVKALVKQQCIKALEECGLSGEGFAKKNITEQHAIDTGNLRNSIAHKVDSDRFECYIGTNVEYAPYVEFGTGIYTSGGRQTPWLFTDSRGETHMTHGMRPRPYLKPAVAEHANDYQNIIKSNLSLLSNK